MTRPLPDTPPSDRLPIGPLFPWLAPLAGYSDLPFRLLCREYGAAAACTEMVSAKGLIHGLRAGGKGGGGTEDLLLTLPEDAPLVVQLFGAEPEFLAEAVHVLKARGFVWFDLNMGCSVPKVTRTGAGAALLRSPETALAAAEAVFQAAGPGRAGCKIRLGWDVPNFTELGPALERRGAAWITLHPRLARQGFSGAADHAAFGRLANGLGVPLVASGDLFTPADALRALRHGASGVMFARGAMNNPAIFRRYLTALADSGTPGAACPGGSAGPSDAACPARPADPEALSPAELRALILRHAELARRLTPGRPGRAGLSPALLKMRTFVPRYVRHLPGARHLRKALTTCADWEELERLTDDFPVT